MADTDGVSKDEIDKILEHGSTLTNQPELKSIVDNIQLEETTDKIKSLTNFWLWFEKLLLEVAESKAIIMRNSLTQSIMTNLKLIDKVLVYVQRKFCNSQDTAPVDDSETPIDDSQAIDLLAGCAARVGDVIKSLQKKHWLRWYQSAKNISALIPIFKSVNKEVKKIKFKDSRLFCYFFIGCVENSEIYLGDIKNRILFVTVTGIIGGFVLSPFTAVGAVAITASVALGGIAVECLTSAQQKGKLKGEKFLKQT